MLAPLKNKKKIEFLFRLGEKKSSGFFECRCLSSSEEGGGLRFVVVAPKKNFPRAVDRNKIKRRMREIVRKKRSLLESSGFNWFLFVYLKEEVLSSGAMQKEFTKLIRSL
jgi:ribonuclease P protein component